VKAHLTSIFRKLKITNRSQAIVLSRRLSGVA
jgi:DNA-binding CsgD family transcriptional regulator